MNDELTYLLAGKPDPAATIEVLPGVHWIRMPLPFALDHINLWLLEDGDGWTIVDTGLNTDTTKGLWQRLFAERLGARPVRRVIVTHFHPDHAGLAGWLVERLDTDFLMTETEWLYGRLLQTDTGEGAVEDLVAFFRRTGCDDEFLDQTRTLGVAYAKRTAPLPRSFQRLRDGDEVAVNGVTWRVVVGTGHAPEHACLYSPELQAMISGDQVLPRISPNVGVYVTEPEANPLADFLSSIDKLLTLPEDTRILPSHNEPFQGLHTRLHELADHHEARLGDLLADLDRPKTAMTLASTLFKRPLDKHQTGFAIAETLSHLHLLRARGEVTRQDGPEGAYHYVRN